jgi:hypothetical protein
MTWWWILACSGGDPEPTTTDDDPGTTPVPTAETGVTTATTSTDTDTDPDTGGAPTPTGDTGATVDPCAPSATLAVTGVSHAQPWRANELEVTVTLSEPAAVAVACTLRADPTEVHLVEGADPLIDHTLRLAGLLADEDYDCVAAAICPTSPAPATPFTVTTGANPAILPSVTTTTFDPGAGSEYVLVNHSDDCSWQTQRLLVLDRDGRVRWWFGTPQWVGPSVEFVFHGGTSFAWGGGWSPNELGRPRLVDLYDGETYDSAVAIPDFATSRFHHDGKLLDDGRLLTLEEVPLTGGGFGLVGFRVRRIDPVTNTVDFDYHSQRGLDEGHLPGGFGDAWHANWVDIVDINGQEVLLVSLCNLGWTVAIDVATGAPLSGEFPQCEHGLEYDAGHLLVYDNGTGRRYSRATEYQLDELTSTATLLWTWTEPDWYETTLGSVDWMPGGRVLIGMGHAECFSSNRGDRTTVVEIDPTTGTKLWEARYDAVEEMAYRADWADACALFANARYCPDVATRLTALAGPLTP